MNQQAVNLLSQKTVKNQPLPAENAISSEDDSSDAGRRGSGEKGGSSPNVDPEVAAYIKEHFNDQLSDDEDNSWADELSEHGIDDYYGEEGDDAEYGDENSPIRGGIDASPTIENSVCVEAEEKEDIEQPKKLKINKKTIINVFCTEYDVIKKVAKKVNEFKLVEIEEDHEGGVHKG
jgi:hypothetical protein